MANCDDTVFVFIIFLSNLKVHGEGCQPPSLTRAAFEKQQYSLHVLLLPRLETKGAFLCMSFPPGLAPAPPVQGSWKSSDLDADSTSACIQFCRLSLLAPPHPAPNPPPPPPLNANIKPACHPCPLLWLLGPGSLTSVLSRKLMQAGLQSWELRNAKGLLACLSLLFWRLRIWEGDVLFRKAKDCVCSVRNSYIEMIH